MRINYRNIVNRYKKHKKPFNNLLKLTKHLSFTDNIYEKLFLFINKMGKRPVCKNCKKEIKKFIGASKGGYHNYCSISCAKLNRKEQEKKKKTCLKKYGTEFPQQNEIIKNKLKQTKLERYGDENYNNREKSYKTKLERYGDENYNNKKKAYKTSVSNNKGEHFFQTKEFREKRKKICLKKYGTEFPQQNEIIKNKNRKSYVDNNFYKLKFNFYWDLESLFDIGQYNTSHYNNKYPFQCNICGTVFSDDIYAGHKPRCPKCFPFNRSKGEQELADFISQHIEIIENDRELIKPYEIDILIPELKLGIEYNGNYYHTEKFGRDVEYHQNKINLMNEAGYDLIFVWEDEWNSNKEEIKNDLLEILDYWD